MHSETLLKAFMGGESINSKMQLGDEWKEKT